MRQALTFLTLFLSTLSPLLSQNCNTNRDPKILLIGDSWANFMHLSRSIEDAMDNYGFSDLGQLSSQNLCILGARTTTFLNDSALLADIETEILDHPSLEFVHLSIGGNDVMGDWDVNFTAGATDTLLYEVIQRAMALKDYILSINPELTVVWAGYCFANFGDVIAEVPTNLQPQHPYYGAWQNMDFPDFIQINHMLRRFSDSVTQIMANDPNLHFVPALGLMQYHYGQNDPLNVPPLGTYPAGIAPIDTGYLEYPSPAESMISLGNIPFTNIGLFDCFHLNPDAYEVFMDYQFSQYYMQEFMEDQQTNPIAGGSLNALGQNSTLFKLGNFTEEERLFLDFNYTIPDTGIAKASLFLKRKNVQDGNVIDQATSITVDFFYPYAGSSTSLDSSDFYALADSSFSVCIYGDLDKDNNWLRLDLPEEAASFLQLGQFQMRISAQNVSGELVEFYDHTNLDHAPILDLKYGPKQYQTLANELIANNDLKIYPNPSSNGTFYLEKGEEVLAIEAYNLNGQRLAVDFQEGNNQFQLPTDFSGLTIVQLQLANGKTAVAKLMKL
jgi:lysophospholipase L1-like esterase